MLRKNKSKNTSKWKFAILAPLLALFMLAFNTQVIAQEKKSTQIKEANNVKIDLVIDKNAKNEELNKNAELFKKQFDIALTFKGIKRNSANEITAIKIDAKGPNLRAKLENSGNKPINPIKISYDEKHNSISIGNAIKLSKKHYAYNVHKKDDGNENFVFISSDDENKKPVKQSKLKNDKNHVWVYKTDSDDKNGEESERVIVIKNGKKHVEIIDDNNTKINTDNGNVFIIKQTSGKDGSHTLHSKTKSFWFSSDNKKPLIIIDGKETSNGTLDKIDSKTIKKMEVLKGESAINKYGEKGKNGVILITTKKE